MLQFITLFFGLADSKSCRFGTVRVTLKGILPDFAQRALLKISKLKFLAPICSSPPSSTVLQRNLAEMSSV